MILASIMFVIFIFLFLTADENIARALVTSCLETQDENIKKIQIEMNLLVQEMKRNGSLNDKKKINEGKKLKKKLSEAQKQLEQLQKGKISLLDIIPMAGYRLMQLMGWDSSNNVVKKLNQQCLQFKEKKEAINYTYYLLAALFGNLLLGGVALFTGIGFGMGMGMGVRSLLVGGVAFAIFALMGYVPYDNVHVIIQKRADDIERQFPQVMSKMALLTVAGMEVNQAWKLASTSGTGTLYEEMNRVLIDFDNNVSPTDAYSRFIVRCNNRYTTKLATAIIQNISKGNSEIVKLFRTLNDESWMEHKHNARRMGEKIQSKLLLPTMLMFGGIIILIIVPVMSGFNL
jgi:tight adherence protein C